MRTLRLGRTFIPALIVVGTLLMGTGAVALASQSAGSTGSGVTLAAAVTPTPTAADSASPSDSAAPSDSASPTDSPAATESPSAAATKSPTPTGTLEDTTALLDSGSGGNPTGIILVLAVLAGLSGAVILMARRGRATS